MTTKEYLEQGYKAYRRIKMLTETRETIKAELYSAKSPRLTAVKVQTSTSGDSMERMIAKADEITRSISDEISELLAIQNRIKRQIDAMPTRRISEQRQAEVLYRRYVLFQGWEKIASAMDKTTRYIFMVHGNALITFAKINKITS